MTYAKSNQPWRPELCPITLRPFFMLINHPELGDVPTYGGPFDSYTIPEPDIMDDGTEFHDIEFTSHKYDHDFGGWVDDENTVMCIAKKSRLHKLGVWD